MSESPDEPVDAPTLDDVRSLAEQALHEAELPATLVVEQDEHTFRVAYIATDDKVIAHQRTVRFSRDAELDLMVALAEKALRRLRRDLAADQLPIPTDFPSAHRDRNH